MQKGWQKPYGGADKSKNSNNDPGTATIMSNVLTGVTILPPEIPQVAQIRTFDFSLLVDQSKVGFTWTFTQRELGEAFKSRNVFGYFDTLKEKQVQGVLEQSFTAKTVKANREEITTALKDIFGDDLPDIQESEIATVITEGPVYFRGVPVLVELGKIPNYSTSTN